MRNSSYHQRFLRWRRSPFAAAEMSEKRPRGTQVRSSAARSRITACGCSAALPIIPTFPRQNDSRGRRFRVAPEYEGRAASQLRRNRNEWNTEVGGHRAGGDALPDSWEFDEPARADACGRAG